MFQHIVALGCAVITTISGSFASAQGIAGTRVASQARSATAQANSSVANVLNTTLTIDVRGVTLETALREIGKQSGATIVFSKEVLPSRSVSVRGEGISVASALKQALRGTNLTTKLSSRGEVLVIPPPSHPTVERQQGVITGKVTDAKSGRGINGATISIETDSRGATTDEDGSYRLAGVITGQHTIIVRLVGYAKQTHSVVVGDGATVTVNFKLEPSANVLDQVVVTGTVAQTELKAVPNAITVITAKQIEERGITRIDQLFRGDIPGLYALNMGSQTFLDEVTMFSRGATAVTDSGAGGSSGTVNGTNPIKTYVDGIEMVNSRYLSQIDPSSIERIEILTGPQASTIYGANAINGVMQIFTKRGRTSTPQLSLASLTGVVQNNFNSHLAPTHIIDASLSGTEGRVSYNVGGSWDYAGAWTPAKQTQRLSANGGSRMEWSKYTIDATARRGSTQNKQRGDQVQGQTDLRANGAWLPTAATTLTLPAPKTQSLLGQTLGVSLGFRPFLWWSHDLGVGSDAATTESIASAASFSSTTDTSLSISSSRTSRVSERYTTTMQLPLSSLTRLNLTIGGDHWRTVGSSWSGSSLSLTGSIGSPSVTRNKPSKNSGAFIQGQFSVKDALFFTYGVRADWNPSFGDKAKVKPGRYGVSFAHDIETPLGLVSTKLRGSYGRSIRPPIAGRAEAKSTASTLLIPLFGVYDIILANPELGPEHQQGGEGGVELYFGSRASLVVTRFNQTVDNLISQVGTTIAANGPGLDSVRSITNVGLSTGSFACSSDFRDSNGYCYRYQQKYLNVGSIRNQGWELQGSVNTGPLTTRGTYSWTKSRVLGVTPAYKEFLTGTDFEPGRPFDFIPEHVWALGLTYAHSSSTLSLTVNGSGMRYIFQDELNVAASPSNRFLSSRPSMFLNSANYHPLGAGYAMADLNAIHNFSARAGVTIQVNNLTNYYQNDFRADYASIGRQAKVGFRWRMLGF